MINIVANLLEYKMAQRVERADKRVRDDLHALYSLIHDSVLEELAAMKGVEGNMPHHVKAQMGHLFIRSIFNIVDELYANHDHVSLGEMLDTLVNLNKLISDNQYIGYDELGYPSSEAKLSPSQFSQVVQCMALMTGGTQAQRKQMFQKAITALHKVHSSVKQLIVQIEDISEMDPSAVDTSTSLIDSDNGLEDLGPQQRAMVGAPLMNKFVRIWGPKLFNIEPTIDQMSELARQPKMNGPLTSFLNSLNRGNNGGSDSSFVISELKKIMDPYLKTPSKEA